MVMVRDGNTVRSSYFDRHRYIKMSCRTNKLHLCRCLTKCYLWFRAAYMLPIKNFQENRISNYKFQLFICVFFFLSVR